MSQSPISLRAFTDNGTVDALPLSQPRDLFECLYKPRDQVNGCFKGDHGHGNFVVQGTGPLVRFRGAEFELKKIHLHSGSEHVVEHDEKHDLELHFVHVPYGSPVASPLVVIGVLFRKEEIPKKSALERNVDKLIESAQNNVCITLSPLTFFPKLSINKKESPDTVNWFHYEGSLTSFPYSENVSWIVMKTEAVISTSAIAQLEKYTEQEPRPIQPLERRLVVRSFA